MKLLRRVFCCQQLVSSSKTRAASLPWLAWSRGLQSARGLVRTNGCARGVVARDHCAVGRCSRAALWSIPLAETSWGGPGGQVPALAKRWANGHRLWAVDAACDQRLHLLPADGRVDGRTLCLLYGCGLLGRDDVLVNTS